MELCKSFQEHHHSLQSQEDIRRRHLWKWLTPGTEWVRSSLGIRCSPPSTSLLKCQGAASVVCLELWETLSVCVNSTSGLSTKLSICPKSSVLQPCHSHTGLLWDKEVRGQVLWMMCSTCPFHHPNRARKFFLSCYCLYLLDTRLHQLRNQLRADFVVFQKLIVPKCTQSSSGAGCAQGTHRVICWTEVPAVIKTLLNFSKAQQLFQSFQARSHLSLLQ